MRGQQLACHGRIARRKALRRLVFSAIAGFRRRRGACTDTARRGGPVRGIDARARTAARRGRKKSPVGDRAWEHASSGQRAGKGAAVSCLATRW
jgi:hypothetical protein